MVQTILLYRITLSQLIVGFVAFGNFVPTVNKGSQGIGSGNSRWNAVHRYSFASSGGYSANIRPRIAIGAAGNGTLDAAIKQACGVPTNVQHTAQQHYIDVVKLVKEHGFKCSIPNDIAIKKDIAQFLDIPESTLDSFLRKHKDEIVPIKLDRDTIRAAGYKARLIV